ncbi:hypothetical protein ACIHEI_06275 [Kitasatospora sp. NPDC051984]|uniref:hypothetical protein n=1 Tax=Kitasatospora sp. NPDC051984 TaxID=3364059 RepID=UPI0037C69E9D
MATTEYVNADYPVPTNRFVLDIDGDGKTDGVFASVSGLEAGVENIREAVRPEPGRHEWRGDRRRGRPVRRSARRHVPLTTRPLPP